MEGQVQEAARGLPNAHYIDPATHAAEVERLFARGWAALVHEARMPQVGDAIPVDFLGRPLVAIRNRDGAVRVFHNVCRHRGMILVDAPRRVEGAIRCPYHSWCYATDGRLVATPHVGGPGMNTAPGIERSELGLVEVRSAVWRGVVFVNLDGDAPDFADHVAPVARRWAPFEGQAMHDVPEGRFDFDVACNWKLAVENYCESYHLPWIHPGLNAYSRLEDHYDIIEDGAAGQGTRAYRPPLGAGGRRFPDFSGVTAPWEEGAEYIALYPNLLLGQHRDHAYTIILEPRGQGRTVERVAIAFAADVAGADWAAMRSGLARLWHEVFAEDVFVVEGMQTGRRSPGFDGGRFSPAMDAAPAAFHDWVRGRMAG